MNVKFLYHYCNDPSPNSHNQLWEIKYWSWSWKSLVLTLCPVIIAMSFSLVKTPSAVSLGGANMVRCVLRQDWQEESRHYHWQWSHNFTWVAALVQHLSESMVIYKKKNTQNVCSWWFTTGYVSELKRVQKRASSQSSPVWVSCMTTAS